MKLPKDQILHIETQDTCRLTASWAEEVTRCKNCKYNYGNEQKCSYNPDDIVCTYWGSDGLTESDFCSRGEE